MSSLPLTKTTAIALASGGLISGFLADWFWERTSRVSIDPLDGDPHAVISVLPEVAQQQWWAAQFRADQQIGRSNTCAARWTAAAVVLGTLSSAVGLF